VRILDNPVYCGDYVFGRRARGKFSRIIDGKQADGCFEDDRAQRNKKPLLRRDSFEALVDRSTFDRVQRKLAERRKTRRLVRSNGYPLSGGLLQCGCCGTSMCGATIAVKEKYTYRKYVCSAGAHQPGHAKHSIDADAIL